MARLLAIKIHELQLLNVPLVLLHVAIEPFLPLSKEAALSFCTDIEAAPRVFDVPVFVYENTLTYLALDGQIVQTLDMPVQVK